MPQFELLEGLPGYGPMYIPITSTSEPFYSEGFVLRFFPAHGEPWVANIRPGLTSFNATYDFPEHGKAVIIAGGEGYIIDPERQQALRCFGGQFQQAIAVDDHALVFVDTVRLTVLFLRTGELWCSERISLDGLRNVQVVGRRIAGESWLYSGTNDKWEPFIVDLDSRRTNGGSFSGTFGQHPLYDEAITVCESIWRL